MRSEMVNMNCEMIRDLIPLYSEGLCSDVSRKIVEEHTASCETCRQLLTQIPADAVPDTPMPDESKPFRKVHKKLKKSRLRNVILSVALAAVAIPVGYLTVGQIVKQDYGMQSFETVWQSIEVRQLVKKLAEGDIEGYMTKCSWGDYGEIDAVNFSFQDYLIIHKHDMENLKQAYEKAFGDTRVESIKVSSEYASMASEPSSVVYTRAVIAYENGEHLIIDFHKREDGLYSGYCMETGESEEHLDFEKALNYVDEHELVPRGWFEELLMTGETPLTEEQIGYAMSGILERFDAAYHEQLKASLSAFYQKGYLVDNCILTLRYDEEKRMLYHDAVLFAKDGQGSAIMQTRLYTTYRGLIPPMEDDITICTDGCTAALASDLANLFG